MRRIISNKVYDTSTARKMGTYRNPKDSGIFYYYEYTLYRKKTGEFFLHACGRSNSHESIMPLTYDEAQEWAEELLTEEQYKGIFFGVVDEVVAYTEVDGEDWSGEFHSCRKAGSELF